MANKCEHEETVERQAAEIERLAEEGRRQAAEIERLAEEGRRQAAEIGRQAAEIGRLRRANAHDGGPNAPPSHRTLSGKAEASRRKRSSRAKRQGGSPARRPGAQRGHKGSTSKPKPTRFKTHTPDSCRRCGGNNLEVTGSTTRYITETPPPTAATTTQHTINKARCNDCGLEDIGPETDLPREGAHGRNVVSRVAENFVDRMPNRMNADRMRRDGAPMSAGTVHSIVKRTGRALRGPASAIMAYLLACNILNIDETSFSLNGKLVWVWIITDPITGMCAYVIRDSRGRRVLEEVLGGWAGTIICDGWKAYGAYRIQRCWAHVLREIRDLGAKNPDDWNAAHVTRMIERIFGDALDASRACTTPGERKAARRRLIRRTRHISHRYRGDPVVGRFMGKLDRAAGDLFEFVMDPLIPPTNNIAERGLREIVVHRKIRGAIRAMETMDWMGNLFTCVMTWKSQGKNYLEELVKYG